jgi:hypothetical protein
LDDLVDHLLLLEELLKRPSLRFVLLPDLLVQHSLRFAPVFNSLPLLLLLLL